MNLGSYSGNAGDSIDIQNNSNFSTTDRDNDSDPTRFNNAVHYSGAWWYSDGLNSSENLAYDGIIWYCAFLRRLLNNTVYMEFRICFTIANTKTIYFVL